MKPKNSDLQFTQKEVVCVVGLLMRNPQMPGQYETEYPVLRQRLLAKFDSIDRRFTRSASTRAAKIRWGKK